MAYIRIAVRPVLLACLVAALAAVASLSSASAGQDDPPAGASAQPTPGQELIDKRTRTSKTFASADGRGYVSRLFPAPVHYKDEGGDWQEIENELIRDTDMASFTNRANRHEVDLPMRLAGRPVRIAEGDRWLSVELENAGAAPAEVADNRVRFDGVFPGVAVELESQADALKETLMLADAQARSTFDYRIEASSGLKVRETRDGGVEVVDGAGEARFALPAPFVQESGAEQPVDKAKFDLSRAGEGWRLRLTVDRDWLERPGRRFPVAVDPTTNLTGPGHDCTLDNEVPTTSACSNTTFSAGHWNGFQRHGVVKFDVAGSSIPRDAIVLKGTMAVKESSAQSLSTPKKISAHRLTRSWTPPPTWNTYDGTNAWTTPGGDYVSTALDTQTANAANTWFYWQMTDQVQRWVDRSDADHGVLMKGADPLEVNKVWFHSSEAGSTQRPYLEVEWEPRLSERPSQTLDGQPPLSDRMGASVNVANGNLQIVNTDLNVSGRMLDLVLTRQFNSRWNGSYSGAFGRGGTGSLGIDVWLRDMGNGNAAVYLGNGAPFYFKKSGTNTFTSPPEIDADLKYDPNVGNGDYVLTLRRSGIRYVFSELGWPVKRIEDRHLDGTIGRNKIELTYDTNNFLDTIVDTQGRSFDVTSNSSGRITGISDPTGRTWGYTYGTTGGETNRVITYTDPEGKVTDYDYDASGNLIKITTPGSRVTEFTWHTDGKVKDVKRLLDPATSDYATTTYTYSTAASGDSACNAGEAKTVATNPRGKNTTYCSDPSNDRVRKTVDARGHEREGQYTTHGNVQKLTIGGTSGSVYNLNYETTGTDPTQNLKGGDAPAGETFSIAYPDPATTTSRLRYLPNETTNPQGSKTAIEYDNNTNTGVGDVTLVKDGNSPTQVKAKLDYNTDGTLQTAMDGNGRTTTYDYFTSTDVPTPPANQIGNLEKVIPPTIANPVSGSSQLGQQKFTYDSLGRIATFTDGKNQVQTFTYDKLDRIKQVTYTTNSINQGTIDYTYDFDGNRTLRKETVGGTITQTSYDYDKLNRGTKETYPSSKVNDYTYDKTGNLSTFKSTLGANSYQVLYGFDDVNNLTSLAEPGGSCTSNPTVRCTTFTYDNRDRRDLTTLPNGVVVDNDWDTSSKVKRIKAQKGTNPALVDLSYDYADASAKQTSLRQKETDNTNSDITTFLYDANDRLKKAETTNGTVKRRFEYTFDNASNRREEKYFNGTSTATTTYKYNEVNQLCWERGAAIADPLPACNAAPTGSTTYVHDANGNETSNSAGRSFSYNVRNQITSHTSTGGTSYTAAHLGEGQSELVQFGTPTLHNSALGVQVRTSGSGNYFYIREPDGSPIGATYPDGGRAYFLGDALGSVVELADVNGATLNTYLYEPFGADLSTTGSTSNYIKFAGGFDTTGSGKLYHFGARYYDPLIGRWTQQDPLDQAGDLREGNRYLYVAGDPVNNTDPTGMLLGIELPDSIGDAVRGCATGAIGGALRGGVKGAAIGCGLGVFDATPLQIGFNTLRDGARWGWGVIRRYDCGNRGGRPRGDFPSTECG
ncbi:MAG: DNRLRE domain-containing protein [Actinomycetota bacterium]|nr:DNRLRE domain-containing protein [Actinomycetota bacterium]